jgi:hypothetical protein
MSFNKRYVDHKKILIYKNRLNDLFSDKIDAFFFRDEFSKKIFDMFNNKEFDLIDKKISDFESNYE